MMNEILTNDEIEDRFDSEWILIQDPEMDKDLNLVRGKVIYHSKDRDDVYQKAVELRLKHSAVLYTGTMPENTAIVL